MVLSIILIIILAGLTFGIFNVLLAKSSADEMFKKYKKKARRRKEMKIKKENDCLRQMNGAKKDFAVSSLSLQLVTLKSLLDTFENPSQSEKDYVIESLRRVEGSLKGLRGFLNN